MNHHISLSFLKEKINELGTALFYPLNDAVLKFPTCVIKVLQIDEMGGLWFLISRPTQTIHAFESSFPVKLDFFCKGRDYYLKTTGNAFLVDDPEEINALAGLPGPVKLQAESDSNILVRVTLSHVDYISKTHEKTHPASFLVQVRNKIYKWFGFSGQEGAGFRNSPAQVHYPSITTFTN